LDTLSHALWGKALFGYRGSRFSPLLLGAAPDLIAFLPWMIIRILNGTFFDRKFGEPPPLEIVPDWVFFMYDFSHSFVTGFLLVFLLYYFRKDYLWFAALAWPFHTVLDFPFHTKEFFPTKIFWPFSDFYIDGIPWSRPEVWFTNIILLALVLFYKRRKNIHKR
jgi:hypothetical protein|tara:strand:- start:123 stop:614 length:492 start_codon:yes stop_codon:yes gene_type:complete